MADNANQSDKDLYEAWGLYLQAINENPAALAQFDKLLTSLGIAQNDRTLENEAFCAALKDFSVNLPRLPEGAEQNMTSAVPREILEQARIFDIVSDKKKFHTEYKRRFVARLVDNYVKELRDQQRINATALRENILKNIEGAADEAALSQKILESIRESSAETENAAVAQRVLSQKQSLDEMRAALHIKEVRQNVMRGLFQKEAAGANPEIFEAALVQQALDHPTDTFEEGLSKAQKTALTIRALAAARVENEKLSNGDYHPEAKNAISNLFRSYSDAGAKNALAPAADMIVSLFGPDTQFAVADILIGKAFKNAVYDKQLESYVRSVAPSYFPTLQTLRNRADLHIESLKNHSRVARYLAHLGSGPTDAIKESITFQATQGDLLAKLTLRDRLPDVGRMGLPGLYHYGALHSVGTEGASLLLKFWLTSRDGAMALLQRQGVSWTHVLFSVRDAAGWGLRWGAGQAGKRAGGALASWGIKTLLGKAAGALLGQLAIPIPFVGAVIGGLVGNLALGKIFGGIKGLFGGGPGKHKWHEDPGSWQFAAILVGLPLIIIFFLSFQTMSMLSGAFFITSPRVGGGPINQKPIVYNGPLPPVADRFLCPVDSGKITQGPNGDYSHQGINAYDIGTSPSAPVFTMHPCVVQDYKIDIPNNTYIYKDFGNFVRCVGVDSGGQAFFTTSAHLESQSGSGTLATMLKNSYSTGTVIAAGTIIGHADNTGYTDGTHIHQQFDGTAAVGLPPGCAGT